MINMTYISEISIIVPTYNCEAFIDECLGSILSQLPENCELIVVDDGSVDGTREKLEKYRKIEKVQVAFCEHKGVSATRNFGLNMASGKYIAFLDCDDCTQDNFFASIQPLLAKDADLYIFGIERIFLDKSSEIWKLKDHEYLTVSDFADAIICFEKKLMYGNCNKLYRKSIIDKANLRFDESSSFGEDRILNFEYLKACDSFGEKSIITSELLMLKYIQRSTNSLSTRYIPDYDKVLMYLHEAKVDCFSSLSRGTTAEEKEAYKDNDLIKTRSLIAERQQ